jgi:hypothetical protein
MKFIRDRHSPVASEGARRDFDPGRGLSALVLVEVDLPDDPADGLFVVAFGDDRFEAQILLDVKFQDRVEDVIRRQRVLIGLVVAKFG